MKRLLLASLLACLVEIVPGCATVPSDAPSQPPPAEEPVMRTPKDLGKAILGEILRQFRFVKDPEVLQLVNQTGRRLVRAAGSDPGSYHFFVVQENQLNAFAIPGGYIFLFQGLLAQVESVDELAGVLAHEIAHVEKGHFFKDQKKIMAMELATIAAILLGGPEAAVLAQAAGANLQLQYSRENENEADAAALVYLQRAGFDPTGLVRFFETLASYERFNPPLFPSYFSTHPGVQERVQTVSTLLLGVERFSGSETLREPPNRSPADGTGKSDDAQQWERMRVIVRALSAGPDRSVRDFQRMIERVAGPEAPPERRHYLLGLALLKADRITQAIPEYLAAIEINPDQAIYHSDLAYCYLRVNRLVLAKTEALHALRLTEDSARAHWVLGTIATLSDDPKGALEHYQAALSLAPWNPQIHLDLGQLYRRMGEPVLSAYHLGRYARLNLEPNRALEQFRYAKDAVEAGSELALEIEKELEEILREGI